MALNKEEKQRRKEQRRIEKWNREHKIIDGIDHKICNICQEWFPATLEYFYKNKLNSLDGLYPSCKKCEIKKADKYQKDVINQERIRKSARKRNAKPDFKIKMREYSKRQKLEGYQKEYQQNNPDKIKQYNENRRHKNHNISKKEWECCKHYFNYECAYCGMPEENHKMLYNQQLHKEHVVHEGDNDLSNCVPSCKHCNSQKWKFNFEEWYVDYVSYSKERYNKIIKWLKEDFKLYIK